MHRVTTNVVSAVGVRALVPEASAWTLGLAATRDVPNATARTRRWLTRHVMNYAEGAARPGTVQLPHTCSVYVRLLAPVRQSSSLLREIWLRYKRALLKATLTADQN